MIGLTQAKSQLSAMVDDAVAGEEIIISRNGKPIAKLVGLKAARRPDRRERRFGFWEQYGCTLPETFNDPDPEIEALFNDGPDIPGGLIRAAKSSFSSALTDRPPCHPSARLL